MLYREIVTICFETRTECVNTKNFLMLKLMVLIVTTRLYKVERVCEVMWLISIKWRTITSTMITVRVT